MQKERTADLSPIGGSRRTGYTSKSSAFDRQFIVCIEIFSEQSYLCLLKMPHRQRQNIRALLPMPDNIGVTTVSKPDYIRTPFSF